MKCILFSFLLYLLVIMSGSQVNAVVTAEASTGNHQTYSDQYDLSDLSDNEMKWFVTFLEGTFFADGWQEISTDILVKISPAYREQKQYVLTRLGNKIGREWCKDNDVRKIDTSMLKKWGHRLRSTAKNEPHLLAEVLESIDGEIDSLLD